MKREYVITPEMVYGPGWEKLIPEGREWEFRPPRRGEDFITPVLRVRNIALRDEDYTEPRIVLLPRKRKQYILTETGEVRQVKQGEYMQYSTSAAPVLWNEDYTSGTAYPIYRLDVREVEE